MDPQGPGDPGGAGTDRGAHERAAARMAAETEEGHPEDGPRNEKSSDQEIEEKFYCGRTMKCRICGDQYTTVLSHENHADDRTDT